MPSIVVSVVVAKRKPRSLMSVRIYADVEATFRHLGHRHDDRHLDAIIRLAHQRKGLGSKRKRQLLRRSVPKVVSLIVGIAQEARLTGHQRVTTIRTSLNPAGAGLFPSEASSSAGSTVGSLNSNCPSLLVRVAKRLSGEVTRVRAIGSR